VRCRPGLRTRLGLAALLLAALAVLGAGLVVTGLARTQALAAEALAAQRRIEAYAGLSARVNEWVLAWLAPSAETARSEAMVLGALQDLDRLIEEDVAAARSSEAASDRGRQSVTPARIRAQFEQLRRTFETAPPGTPEGEAAVAFYGAQVPGLVGAQVQQEARRRDEAMAAMETLRDRLHRLALGVGLAAPLLLAGLYLMGLRPLFARLAGATASAASIAAGQRPVGLEGHDELGLLLARLRLVAARVARERDRLEATVAERTRALSRANERLARIDSERRRFFADVGHELRTPLTVILGEAELGARHADPALQASFGTIRSRAERLGRRVEDLLRIARSESGQLELDASPVDLGAVVNAARADVAPLLARAGVTVEAGLPPLRVTGDADWLRQIFAGFLENAAKYAGRGATVRITGGPDGGWAEVVVADSGPGVPEAGREETLFGRFSRGAASGPGFGVGLALARWVVDAHGGALTAETAEAGGLRLVVRLPLAAGAEAETAWRRS
jgi:signal transduction histidine kinase